MASGKMVVLKPVVWNDKGYVWPAGITAGRGYSRDHGYGHEEWNGRSDWVWNGWKVFHTQAKGEMHRYAAEGRLGIIMTTMREKRFFAVGVGCNVFENNEADNVEIAEALGLRGYTDGMWKVDSIRDAKRGRRADLDRHWQDNMHVNWRCPQTHFAWFGEPVPIEPNALIPRDPPRQAIVKMHGSYQAVRPDQALAIVRQTLAPDHPAIAWLSTGDFDPLRNRGVQGAAKPKGGRRSAGAATDPVVRYMQEYELVVSPLHHRLQEDFTEYLRNRRMRDREANIQCVDLRYRDPARGTVLVEIKPTEPATVRFAVRTAMGQLLDYRQRSGISPAMLVVIDDEPTAEDRELALSNGFGVAWRDSGGFSIAWPNGPTARLSN